MAHDPLNQAGSPALDDTPRAAATPHAHGEPPESSGSDNDTDDGHRRNMRTTREKLRATPVPRPADAMPSTEREEGESRAALALGQSGRGGDRLRATPVPRPADASVPAAGDGAPGHGAGDGAVVVVREAGGIPVCR